jgi:peptidoglycan/xylan/chitin deacetylase (PgdA/CDA1 family)
MWSSPLILCYHAVSDSFDSALAVKRDRLREQVELLAGRGYEFLTYTELERRRIAGTARPSQAALTFDDGYESTLIAADVLAEFGVPGTVYVLPPMIGHDSPLSWPGISHWTQGPTAVELKPMDWDQLGRLAERGWEIGSHTLTHPRLPTLPGDSLAVELAESRAQLIERLGRCDSVAYPYGNADRRVADAARAAGYESGTTLSKWHTADDPMLRPRVGIYLRDDLRRFKLKIARWSRAVRRLPALAPARPAR